jgi:hypothetical protein
MCRVVLCPPVTSWSWGQAEHVLVDRKYKHKCVRRPSIGTELNRCTLRCQFADAMLIGSELRLLIFLTR